MAEGRNAVDEIGPPLTIAYCTKCGFSPGQRIGDMGCEHVTTVARIAPVPGASTQQQFDLSSFCKEVEERLKSAEQRKSNHELGGYEEHATAAEGAIEELEAVLALLPGEEETV